MLPTILLITTPAEETRLAAALRGEIFLELRLRLLGDLPAQMSPAQHIELEHPDILVVGTGLSGVDVAAYVEAARWSPCFVVLICDQAFASVQQIRPDRTLFRPVTGADLIPIIRGSLPVAVTPRPSRTGRSSGPAPSGAAASDLLRVDDLLADDPLALFGVGQKTPPVEEKPDIQVAVDPVLLTDGAAAEAPVVIDPRLYPDTPRLRPAGAGVHSGPPPIPDEAIAASRRKGSLPPPLPRDIMTSRPAQRSTPPKLPAAVLTEPAPPTQPAPQPSAQSFAENPGTEGDLSLTDPPTLIGRLCVTHYTGCLLLVREWPDLAQRALFFERGELCAVSSTLRMDSFSELLYQEGRLTKEQLKRARQLLDRLPQPGSEGPGGAPSNHEMGERLCREQVLPRAELPALLRRHAIEVFYRSFSWERGSYRLLSRAPAEEDVVRLKEAPRLLLIEGIRRKISMETLLLRIGPETTVLRPIGAGPLQLKGVGITATEERALPLFDGRHAMGAIAEKTGLAEHATYVLGYALICLTGLGRPGARHEVPRSDSEPRRAALSDAAATASSGPPAAVVSAPPSGAAFQSPGARSVSSGAAAGGALEARAVEAATARIQSKYEQVKEADYFTLLGVSATAGPVEIRRAYETLKAQFSPAAVPEPCRARLGDELAQIAQVLDEAYSILGNANIRDAYRTHLVPLTDVGSHAGLLAASGGGAADRSSNQGERS